jgi:hypothetical protein
VAAIAAGLALAPAGAIGPQPGAARLGLTPVAGLVDEVLPIPVPTVPEIPPAPPAPDLPPAPEPPPVPEPPPAPAPEPDTPLPAPSDPAPAPSLPDAPKVPGIAGSGGSDAPGTATPGAGPAPSGDRQAGGTDGSGAGSTGATRGGGSAGGERRGGDGTSRRDAAGAGAVPQRRLERTVARLQGCLDELAQDERRVLALRAGIGPGPVLARSEVAGRLDLALAQAGRIERRGLRRLEALAAAGACGGATSLLGSSLGGSSGLGLPPMDGADDGAAAGSAPRSGIKGVSVSGGGDGDGRSDGSSATLPPFGQGGSETLLITLGLLVALALLVRRELSRR